MNINTMDAKIHVGATNYLLKLSHGDMLTLGSVFGRSRFNPFRDVNVNRSCGESLGLENHNSVNIRNEIGPNGW